MPTEQRKHRRAQLTMPVRLRWPGPLAQWVEISKTLDVSRGGALVRSATPGVPGAPLWVTFPYDNSLSSNLPETPARVVRSERQSEDTYVVAIHFEPGVSLNGSAPKPPVERRSSPRAAFAIPALLRAPSSPWAEETMTVDVSSRGIRLTTSRVYTAGQKVLVTLQQSPLVSGWPIAREVPARVVRIVPTPGSSQWHIALQRFS